MTAKKYFWVAKALVFVTFLFAFSGLNAQSEGTYAVTKTVKYNQSDLVSALDKCSFDNYRKQKSRVLLKFIDGSEVELLSFNELRKKGIDSDRTIVVAEDFELQSVFTLHPHGYIVETVPSSLTLEEKKRLGLVK